ncbi:MAG: hypothetical protein PHX18_05350 [Candidatus Gastranaerophilales bacterium]|nr:hypothetical protein [Candidatus Gastranaerophilales bacterium]
MEKYISSNKFYNTFPMFINEKSKTADRTIYAARFERPLVIKRQQKPESFITSATAGGALAVGLTGVCLKRSNMLKIYKSLDLSIARLNLADQNDLFTKITKKVLTGTRFVTGKILSTTRTVNKHREYFFRNLNKHDNQTFLGRMTKQINGFFANQNIKVTEAKYQKLLKEFEDVEKVLNGRIEVIEASTKGKISILLPEKILKTSSEKPVPVNLDLMPDGTSRAAKLREYTARAKVLLQELKDNFRGSDNSRLEQIQKRLTFIPPGLKEKASAISKNIEYNFENAQGILDRLSMIISKNNQNTGTSKLLQEVSELLHKYRFDTITDSLTGNDVTSRADYMSALLKKLDNLDEATKGFASYKAIKGYIISLQKGIQEEIQHKKLGIMEEIRQLVKCKDIKLDNVQAGINPSLLKHYQTNEYLALKTQIDNFSRKLHKTIHQERYALPHRLRAIKSGDAVLDSAFLLAPGAYVTGKSMLSSKKEDTKPHPRFLPYWLGAGVFFLTNTLKMVSMPVAIVSSLLTTLFTTKIQNRLTKNQS